jgi:hypothetical protein
MASARIRNGNGVSASGSKIGNHEIAGQAVGWNHSGRRCGSRWAAAARRDRDPLAAVHWIRDPSGSPAGVTRPPEPGRPETMLYVHVAENHRRELPETIIVPGSSEADLDLPDPQDARRTWQPHGSGVEQPERESNSNSSLPRASARRPPPGRVHPGGHRPAEVASEQDDRLPPPGLRRACIAASPLHPRTRRPLPGGDRTAPIALGDL